MDGFPDATDLEFSLRGRPIVVDLTQNAHLPEDCLGGKRAMTVYIADDEMRDMSHPGHNTSQPPPGPPPPAQSATRSSTNDDSEKKKMIRGQAFKRSDPTLAADRLRCKAALQRFNSAGVVDQTADTTIWKLLQQVITPTPNASLAPEDKTIGSLGGGAVVEPPFDCEYGYNIKIGEDVDIGGNCLIVDVCPVIIGQKTTIGRKVSIISGGPGTDNVDRKGVNSMWQGEAITIGNDVIIGEGSCIYRGVKLGARCTIEPFSVVKCNVDPDQRFGPLASGPIRLGEIGPGQSQPQRPKRARECG
jgi:acetyltransferase-like isoleucine patch superfamily enzyme